MSKEETHTRGEILHRLGRIERHPDVLGSLLSNVAQRAGQDVEWVVGAEAESIYRDALGVGFTGLELGAIRCRCDVARLAVIKARPGSPVAISLSEARHDLAKIESHIRRADRELLAWIVARLRARGWPAWADFVQRQRSAQPTV